MDSLRSVCFQLGFLKGNLGAHELGTYRRESQPGGLFGWFLVEDGAERGALMSRPRGESTDHKPHRIIPHLGAAIEWGTRPAAKGKTGS